MFTLTFVTVSIIIQLSVLIDFSTCENSITSRAYDYSPSYGQNMDSFETLRKIYFPTGAKLTLDPILEVPVVDPNVLGIGSKIKLSFPVEILFHKIPLWNPKTLFEGSEMWNWERNFEHGRHKRSFDLKSRNTNSSSGVSASLLCRSGGTERIAIFKKLEGFWNSYYPVFGSKEMDGKACLLRTICEVHEYPMDSVYGTIGEVAKLVLSTSKIKDYCDITSDPESRMLSRKLKDYAVAELNGRNRRCKKYTKSCDISLFV